MVDKLTAEIDKAKTALLAAGFTEDSEIVKGATKSLTADLTKAQANSVDNSKEWAGYLGLTIIGLKSGISAPKEANGDYATWRPNLEKLRSNDFLFAQSDKRAVVIHSLPLPNQKN